MKKLWILFILGGCATTNIVNFEGIVKKRASYDFNCPENYITSIQLGLTDFGAQGCGQKQEYSIKCSLGPCVAQPK